MRGATTRATNQISGDYTEEEEQELDNNQHESSNDIDDEEDDYDNLVTRSTSANWAVGVLPPSSAGRNTLHHPAATTESSTSSRTRPNHRSNSNALSVNFSISFLLLSASIFNLIHTSTSFAL